MEKKLISIEIPYEHGKLFFSIPRTNFAEILIPKEVSPVENLEETTRQALARPIGCSPLSELVKPSDRVLIVIDDNTRLTPVNKLLPILFSDLKKKQVRDGQIKVLIALGTHRPMTPEEIKLKVGEAVYGRVEVMNHDYKDKGELMDLGKTANGTPIEMNRLALEADFLIGIGSIVPHHVARYSGGSKIILPGNGHLKIFLGRRATSCAGSWMRSQRRWD